nr:unnamed protein product [Callosobruchus chinensis]
MTPSIPKPIMCNMENPLIPRPPALPENLLVPLNHALPFPTGSAAKSKDVASRDGTVRSKNSIASQGFRLMDTIPQNNDETGSIYSIYKQKIDAMFESDFSSTKNSIQAKIEKMFSEVAKDSGIPMNEIGVHSFSVDYLGSVPLQEKVTSLSGLQNPLRNLYFAYKKIVKTKKALTGRLEISNQGLKVQYQGEKGDLEQLNSFPTIAVWSAVKFVIHESNEANNGSPSYAFLPLITDPDHVDKQGLFRKLTSSERKFITDEAHSPLFAVVMRKIGVHKQLECHGFVCQTSEDAIVIAATLYKALVAHMKAKEKRPKNKNGVTTCMSVTSSTTYNEQSNSVPVRPPRKKKSSTSSVVSDNDMVSVSDTKPLIGSKPPKKRRAPKAPSPPKDSDLDAILPYEEPVKPPDIENEQNIIKENRGNQHHEGLSGEVLEIKPKTFTDKLNTCMSKEQKQLTAEIKQIMSEGGGKLKKVQNVRKGEPETIRKKENSTGDILTKVTIPRSGSFLNAGGITRYKNKGSRGNEQASGGSPLGFKEIFNELSLQEGLHSLDDILSVIIDPEGMSFNDLKPIYKEFLLKLSLTLTKDELYQHSKNIMKRQKKRMVRRSSIATAKKNHHVLVGEKFRRLKHVFQRNLKIKLGRKMSQSQGRRSRELPNPMDTKLPESSISTSSYDTRQFKPKSEISSSKKNNYRRKSTDPTKYRRDRTSTSEESDFFSMKRNRGKTKSMSLVNTQNRNSSSGYVSCSECSYDSDTCTCVSADKCYCSLGHKNFYKKQKGVDPDCPCEQSVSFCDCDTDSCTESNKCYCTCGRKSGVFDDLKKRGFKQESKQKHKKLCKKVSNTKSTKSLEYILNPSESYYEKLKSKNKYGTRNSLPSITNSTKVDYELLYFANKSLKDLQSINNMVYTRRHSEHDLGSRVFSGSSNLKKSCYYNSGGNLPRSLVSEEIRRNSSPFHRRKAQPNN